MTLLVVVLTYAMLFALLWFVPLEQSGMVQFGHPKE